MTGVRPAAPQPGGGKAGGGGGGAVALLSEAGEGLAPLPVAGGGADGSEVLVPAGTGGGAGAGAGLGLGLADGLAGGLAVGLAGGDGGGDGSGTGGAGGGAGSAATVRVTVALGRAGLTPSVRPYWKVATPLKFLRVRAGGNMVWVGARQGAACLQLAGKLCAKDAERRLWARAPPTAAVPAHSAGVKLKAPSAPRSSKPASEGSRPAPPPSKMASAALRLGLESLASRPAAASTTHEALKGQVKASGSARGAPGGAATVRVTVALGRAGLTPSARLYWKVATPLKFLRVRAGGNMV
jgi:hypothetical protein